MTLEELERRAYADGDVERAALLARAIDDESGNAEALALAYDDGYSDGFADGQAAAEAKQ